MIHIRCLYKDNLISLWIQWEISSYMIASRVYSQHAIASFAQGSTVSCRHSSGPLLRIVLLTLITPNTWLILSYSCNLTRIVLIIRPIISSTSKFIPPGWSGTITSVMLMLIILICRHKLWLSRISQCISVVYPNCFSQCGWHISLQPLPQHTCIPSPLCGPSNRLRFNHPFTWVSEVAPPSQKFSVSLIRSLLAHGELLRSIRPFIRAREVAHKHLLEI